MRHLLTLLLLTAASARAQQAFIVKDPRIDMLLRKQTELNREVDRLNNKTGPGFRVMVTSTNDRVKALEVKSVVMKEFPEHKSYLVYQAPYFKIQTGNFRQRQDAEELRRRIMRVYPTGVMVVPAVIEMPKDRDEEEVLD